MFEKILEKILIQYFGRFITGLDKNNLKLGVWSGNVAIENVNLKPELIQLLELPIKLKQSSVGKMTIKIPWKKLSSQPVEITIENVFLTVSPLPQNEWKFGDEIIIQKKFEAIQEYCKKCMKRGLKKKKQKSEEEKDKGYLDKMAIKIMDNLQVRIVNIHLRYEGPYCFGISLETLEIVTTDDNWNQRFIDRTEQKNQQLSMNKVLLLQNLAVYWNTEPQICNSDYQQFMSERILKGNKKARDFCHFIITISAQMQLVSNAPQLYNKPLKEMMLELDQLNFIVSKPQFQQMVHLFDQCSRYSNLLWIQRKKALGIDQDHFRIHQKNFAVHYPKIQMSEQKTIEVLEQIEQEEFKAALRAIEYQTLLDWVQITAKQLVKEAKLNQAQNNKVKKETAWWKGSDKKQAQDVYLNEEEIMEINNSIEKIFEEERKKVATRPEDSIEYKFQLNLQGCVILIRNEQEGLQLVLSQISTVIQSLQNMSYDLLFKLEDFRIDMHNGDQIQEFCYKQKDYKISQLMKVHFQKDTKSTDEDASLMVQIDPIECQYDSLFIKRWQDFFNIENVVENIVQDVVQDVAQQSQDTVDINALMDADYKLNLNVNIANPIIYMQQWKINFGNLIIESEHSLGQNEQISQSHYHQYVLRLQDLSVESGQMMVLNKTILDLVVQKLKKSQQDQNNKTKLLISGQIPPISLVLNEELQDQLMVIDKLIFPQRSEQEILLKYQKQKNLILQNCILQGQLLKKESYLWNKYYAILSGNYIYFYKKEHDLRFEDKLCLKGMQYIEQNENMILQNEHKSCNLQFDNEWKEQIKLLLDGEQIISKQEHQIERSLVIMNYKLACFDIKLLKNEETLYELKISDVNYIVNKSTTQMDQDIIIQDIEMIDFVKKYDNPEFQYLLKSKQESNIPFLQYTFRNENNQNISEINIGQIILNWKPSTYLTLTQFAKISTEMFGIEAQQLDEEECEQIIKGDSEQQKKQHKLDNLIKNQKQRHYNSQTKEFIKELINYEQLCNNFEKVQHLFTNNNIKIAQTLIVKVVSAQINLLHRQSHVNLGYLELDNLNHTVQFTQIGKFMTGNIDKVRLFDTTNYPNTLSKYNPIIILQANEGIKYFYSFYNTDYLKDELEIFSSFSQIIINQAEINYCHQQLMRFLNYIFIQVIQLIAEPNQVTLHDGQQQIKKRIYGTIENHFNQFMNPSFMYQEYIIKNAHAIIKQNYNDSNILSITSNNIIYYSDQRRDYDRLINSSFDIPIWSDNAKIELFDTQIELNNQKISNNVNYQLIWQRLLFENEMLELFPDLKIRNNFELFSGMNEIDLQLNQKQLNLLIKILSYNFTFNDQKDNYFIHNYHIVCQEPQIEIRYLMEIPKIQLLFPNFLLTELFQFRIEVFLSQNQEITINLFSKDIKISKLLNDLQETQIIIGKPQQRGFFQQIEQQSEIQIAKNFNQPFNYLTRSPNKIKCERPSFKGYAFKLDFTLNRCKEIIIDFENQIIQAEIQTIMDFIKYIDLKEDCFPPLQGQEIQKKLVLILNFINTLIILPSLKDQIIGRGQFNYILEKSINYLSQKITLQNLELFICDQKEFINNDFTQVEKRYILLPTNIYYGISEQHNQFNQLIIQHDLSMDKAMIQICFQDIETVIGAIKYQQIKNQQQQISNQQTEIPQILANISLYCVQLIIISVDESPVPLFEIQLKDTQLTFSKILQYILNIQQVFQMSYFNVNIGAWEPFIEPILLLMDHTYNPRGNPKEFTSIQINPSLTSDETPQIPLNINITIPSIKALKELEEQWRKSLINLNKKELIMQGHFRKSQIQQDEKIQAVSPYVFDNQTGFDIELTIINKTLKKAESHQVKKGCQFGVKYSENYFSQQIERRQLSMCILDEKIQFRELTQLDFRKHKDECKDLDYKIGILSKTTKVLIQLQTKDIYKIMKVSSNILFINNSQYQLEIKIVHKNAELQQTLFIEQDQDIFIPLGYEQAYFQLRYSKEGIWSQLMDIAQLLQKNNSSFDIFQQTPYLILNVQKQQITTQPNKITFFPPYAIKNSLQYQIDIHLQLGHPITIQPNQIVKVQQSSLHKGFRFNIKLPAFQLSSPITISSQLSSAQNFLLRDFSGLELILKLVPIGMQQGYLTFLIDGGMTFQNSLGLPIFLYGRKKNKQDKDTAKSYQSQKQQLHNDMEYLAGQPIFQITDQDDKLRENGCLQLINEIDYIQFSFDQGGNSMSQGYFSAQFGVNNADGQYLLQVPKEDGYMDILIDLCKVENRKIITVSPRYVLINKLNQNINIVQEKCNKTVMLLSDTKFPFYWFSGNGKQNLKFLIKDLHSGFITLDMQGTVTLPLRNDHGILKEYLSITAKEEKKIKFIIIEEMSIKQKTLYKIINNLDYDIAFYQSEIQELNENIKIKVNINQSVDYSFDNPAFRKLLTIEFYKDQQFSDFVKIELSNSEKSTKQTMVDDSSFFVTSRFSMELRQIEVILSSQPYQIKQQQYDDIDRQLSLYIPSINLSCITQHPRTELINVSIQNIEFLLLDELIQTIQLKIQNIQIDHNQHTRCTYPVLLTQKNIKPEIPVLNLVIKRAHKIDFINYFQAVLFSIQPMVLKLTQGTFDELFQLFAELQIFNKTNKIKKINKWQEGVKKSQQLCFFETIQIYPLKLQLSFQTIEQKNNQYLKSAATQAINCDEVPITLKGFAINDCFTTKDQLIIKLINNYKDVLKANLYKLIGSIDLLGNPMGLIRDVGGGFQDLFEMPYEGFVQGPLEGGVGIAKGVGSLTKGIVSGTFNTVQKITGSVASGISQLSMDDQYLRERQIQNSKKAKTVVHGLGYGMVSLFQGVGLGIAGLVTQPYEGAEKDGVEGFFKGVSKGFIGLVVKPVVGAIDLASKTAEGVKNTANYFDDKPNEIRCRLPRVFYGQEQMFKNYLLQDAELNYILDKLIPELQIIDTFVFQNGKYKFAYVITFKYFIILEVFKKNIILRFLNQEIKGFELLKSDFRIYLFTTKLIDNKKERLIKAQIEIKKDMISIRQDNIIHQFLEDKLKYLIQLIHDY